MGPVQVGLNHIYPERAQSSGRHIWDFPPQTHTSRHTAFALLLSSVWDCWLVYNMLLIRSFAAFFLQAKLGLLTQSTDAEVRDSSELTLQICYNKVKEYFTWVCSVVSPVVLERERKFKINQTLYTCHILIRRKRYETYLTISHSKINRCATCQNWISIWEYMLVFK